ncbi:helix-turn-helix transcriptional regulator [Actinomadura nitritigenes]|uniref:Helix-turn-helix domain-containing protein n=1 Tax=Actinomadura nitritigenes TaxID=134602 RepID=A0ABS3QUN4_9ACTN|nr:helix-turn-helix transcriptional regulator [Actinomadura nitritigenes]MBO2437332.1 helix-turn-helix domain-containing protein [Actinomadura nitritigenes]
MSAGQEPGAAGPGTGAVRGPAARRMLVGARLRGLRERSGLSRDQAGYAIRGSASKISRLELGRTSFARRDVADLLTLYGVPDGTEREELLRLAREANERAWWHRYGELVPAWTHRFLDLEETAREVRAYEPCQIPELLQTEEYTRACLAIRDGIREGDRRIEIDERAAVRRLRRRRFADDPGRTLAAVLDEAALRRFVGGPELIRGQLRHLAALADTGRVELRIIPVGEGPPPLSHGFSILGFAGGALPDVVYLEFLTTALYLDKPADVAAYTAAWGRLSAAALPPDASRALLARLPGPL